MLRAIALVDVASKPSLEKMLMYGKEASNRKQEIDRQHILFRRLYKEI